MKAKMKMTTENKPRLIIVSNRLPVKKVVRQGKAHFAESDGGLVSALRSYCEKGNSDKFEETIWIGAADFPRKQWEKFCASGRSASTYITEPLFIEEQVFNKYYNGFSNATIWPLFHYFPSFADFNSTTFESYQIVNSLFKDKIASIARPDDTIWIHDYHLLLLPGMLRAEIPVSSIGFFLHIPFPSYDIFRLMHGEWKRKIIDGMLGVDLIGFHTHEYVQHFLKTMRMISGNDHRYREIYTRTHLVRVNAFPIGIDYEKFHSAVENEGVLEHKARIRKKMGHSSILFSVDRLDYTKGVTHRLSGFQRFLERYPEWRGKITFVMVVVPSRQIVSKYNERRKLIEEQVGRINGRYSTLDWQPIIYRYSSLGFEELCALYQVADIALITPVRDGMNLVAKEYVASRADGRGVLILSELAGAAAELGEAMLVNPTDENQVADAIFSALQCPVPEQERRMKIMQSVIAERHVAQWVSKFFDDLTLAKDRQEQTVTEVGSQRVVEEIAEAFCTASRRLLLIDYDGTLAPISEHPEDAAPDEVTLGLLRRISEIQSVSVVIVSGRDHQTLANWFDELRIHLVAEHGAALRTAGGDWQHHVEVDPDWKDVVRTTFDSFQRVSPGAMIEEKRHTIAFHYRQMEVQQGFTRSRELLDCLHHLMRNTNLTVVDGHKVIEVRAPGIDKGIAARRILQRYPSDFVLAIGDDKTDEDVFRALNNQAVTIKVGEELTAARYRIAQNQVLDLLARFVMKEHQADSAPVEPAEL
jgi:trehalose 6-phosphate synthase/phosphatase